MTDKLTGLDPIISDDPKVLIAGSMPSEISLTNQEYYGNPRNHFWDILFELFNQETIADYQRKIEFIKQHHLVLWDVIGACHRVGSLDSKITEEEPNDILNLLDNYASIRLIACNGTKSFQTLNKNFDLEKLSNVDVLKLPSTSPIPGRYTKNFAGKVEEWKRILTYLPE
ncbi:DNA-deoxyinosine glycosylase [Virgibacillus phasianinus]|uniref:DNA-deoxyinosine glycosylase n=1 Tax=Virgibacillus phasianinus TaxID=2017483 RepID=A0A220TZ52_9BACI|nr:DNA-deoxyinosine glycosylase [Virgibacillus phasianinus]ASK60946.1 DNA-deoxyinosine glycosylase [Virgibacillus phasianinus]